MSDRPDLALFFATSGHSGVDRGLKLLVPALLDHGLRVDLLKLRGHGPDLDAIEHPKLRQIDLKASHVYSAFPASVRYMRQVQPPIMHTGKDRVIQAMVVAHALAGKPGALVLRMGTTLSRMLQERGPMQRTVSRLGLRWLYPKAREVLVESEGIGRDLRQLTGMTAQRTPVVPLPVIPASLLDEPQPRPDHPWFHDDGPPIVLGVGELTQRKGFDVLLEAFARLRQQRPCRLMIVGEGQERQALTRQAKSLGIDDELAMPGFRTDVYAIMAHAELFAFTSRFEGLGFSLIEALAVGTPVVSTDCPSGPREILQDGRFGSLVPVDDIDALAAAMQGTLDAPQDSTTLQQAAWPFEVNRCTQRLVEALALKPSVPATPSIAP
jgi:glycosyltransferase involved in cell wall biosynthesis